MSFTYQSYIVAEPKIQRVALRSGAGNYFLDIVVEASSVPHGTAVFYIADLRATVRACNLDLGTATPVGQSFLNVASPDAKYRTQTWPSLAVAISQQAMQLIEDARTGADLQLNVKLQATVNAFLQAAGKPQRTQSADGPLQRSLPVCGVENNFYAPTHVEEDIQYTVPQSEWIRLLNGAGYSRSMLFEVPFPKQQAPTAASRAVSHFEAASAAFTRAEYATTVAKCREALESAVDDIGIKPPEWKKLSEKDQREKMSITDRLALCWAATRHTTHQAHHGGDYEREEARYILGMAALAISMALRKPGLLGSSVISEIPPRAAAVSAGEKNGPEARP